MIDFASVGGLLLNDSLQVVVCFWLGRVNVAKR